MMRLDHNRARAQLAGKAGVQVTRSQHDHLGQPLDDPVPRPVAREGQGRSAGDAVGDEAWIADEFIPTVEKRGAEIIEARGASTRRRPPTRRSTTSTTGCSGRPRATGSRWGCPRTAPTASTRGSSLAFRAPAGRRWTIVQGLESRLLAPAHRRSVAELRKSATRSAQLGLNSWASHEQSGLATKSAVDAEVPAGSGRSPRPADNVGREAEASGPELFTVAPCRSGRTSSPGPPSAGRRARGRGSSA